MESTIFEEMKQRLGCEEVSDLREHRRTVWNILKTLPLESYPKEQLEDFSRHVFGVKFSILTEVMKGRE